MYDELKGSPLQGVVFDSFLEELNDVVVGGMCYPR